MQVTIRPSWNEQGASYAHSWEGFVNVDQFHWCVRKDMLEALQMAHDEVGVRHMRAVGMYDRAMRAFDTDPMKYAESAAPPRANFQLIDYVIDSLLDVGIAPVYTTCFTPPAMASKDTWCFRGASNTSMPKDLGAWKAFVTDSIRHMVWRYGRARVRGWYFEVWNEPNLASFWSGTKEEFFALWKATYDAIKEVDPAFIVGGPSTARGEWIADTINFGRENGCEPDYIITHVYNNDSEFGALSPFEGPQLDKISTSPNFASGVIRGVRGVLNELNYSGEVHWNEWGRSWFPCDHGRETSNEAAFAAKTMAEVSQEADYFTYWCISDIYDQVGYNAETFSGHYGMLNQQHIRKPHYLAFQLMTHLGDTVVSHDASGTDECSGAVTTKSDEGYQALWYAYNKDSNDALPAQTVSVTFPKDVDHKHATLYRVTPSENNVVELWKSLGSPAYLRPETAKELRAASALTPAKQRDLLWEVCDEGVRATFSFEGPGVAFITVDR